MSKMTQWIRPEIKPVRVGWYHTSVDHTSPVRNADEESNYNWWWDGSQWLGCPNGGASMQQYRWWRGLTEESAKAMAKKGKA